MTAIEGAVAVLKQAEGVIDRLMTLNERIKRERLAMYAALAQLACPACEHELEWHADKYGCEIERGDHEGGEGDHGPYPAYAMGPCGCNVDDLKDEYPDFARALEAFRLAKVVAL